MRTKDRLAEGAPPEPVPLEDRVALKWRRDRGHDGAARTAVRRHPAPFRERLKAMRRAAEMAQAFVEIAGEAGICAMADAAGIRAEQMLMEQLFELEQTAGDYKQAFTPAEWAALNKAVGAALSNRRSAETMRQQFEQAKHRAVEAVRGANGNKPNGQAIVDRVREILGIPPGDDPS